MRKILAGTLLVVAFAVTGCGGGGSGDGRFSDSITAAKAASAFHMSGQVNEGGQTVGIDMTVVKGKGSTGSMTLKGEKVDLLILGTTSYMKARAGFWTKLGGGDVAGLLADKWIKFKSTDAQFQALASVASKSVFDKLPSKGYTDAGTTTYKGQNVTDLKVSNGHFYVAATGTPYPVALVQTGPDSSGTGGSGTISFDHWNKSVTLTPPRGAIDFSQFTGH